jgi:YidC/Oxa1 family membrane protein insertase
MDKNTILAFVLIAIIIIIYPFFMPKQQMPVQKQQTERVQENVSNISPDAVNFTDSALSKPLSEPSLTADITPDSLKKFVPEEKEITIKTDLYSAVISTKNGVIKSWKPKKYKSRVDTSKIIELVYDETNNLSTEIALKNGTIIKNVIYEADKDNIVLSATETEELLLTFKDQYGEVKYTKKIRFYGDKYSFDLTIDTTPVFSELADKNAVLIKWPDGVKYTEVSDGGKNLNREDYYRATYYKAGDDVVEYDHNDDTEKTVESIDWGATRSKYFEVFFASSNEKLSTFENYPAYAKPDEPFSSMGFSAGFDKGNSPVKDLLVYFGPLDYEIYKSYKMGFEETMNWGWDIVKPFSLGIYWTLKFLHKYISNYGLVIIILSLLVNTLVLPFTIKSYKSQAEMKRIQPELKVIKEKYKTDMQKQQAATMELYKKHNVNPFGMCLPTLLPMPILYGMFIVFGATIEFRSAEFVWWINDLSLPEIMFSLPFSIPLYGANVGLLPIIMGVTMFFQMKDSAASGDANQKMMMYFMPVFLTVLFNNLSSGLILYYTVGNLYRIVQQKLTPPMEPLAKK